MVSPKKHLGQHFLTDSKIAERIAQLVHLVPAEDVLEIGPGKGILTRHLLQQPGKHVCAIEIDHESCQYLKQNDILHEPDLIEGDFLNLPLEKYFPKPFLLIGNFPYNISTQIMFKALEQHDRVPLIAGMFQKEVAYRIAAPSGSKVYGILSVLTQAFYDVQVAFKVMPGAFFPPPKVDSAVISCVHKTNPELGCSEKKLFDVVKTAFNQRRKTLSNSLKKFNLKEAFETHPFAKLRPENLDVSQFIELTRWIEQQQS